MQNKYSLDFYLDSLQKKTDDISNLVDIQKILTNMRKVESDLNSLNYLICNNLNEFKDRVSFLYSKNKDCFQSIFLLIAVRANNDSSFLLKHKEWTAQDILDDKDKIIDLFIESKLIDLILQGKIKNFVDYTYGVEVGMDTNGRKNRNGRRVEDKTYNKLKEIFKDNSNIIIEEQKKIAELGHKVFDIVVTNTKTNKKVLIESSFYNAGGSKVSETARSYQNLFNEINEKLSSDKYCFIWLADGYGMSTIKSCLRDNYDEGYIWNHKMFFDNIKKIVE